MDKLIINAEHVKKDEEAIITEDTMAIFPKYTDTGHLHSIVLGQYQVKYVTKRPTSIVHDSCMYFGSDLNGRMNSAKSVLKRQRMLPILISESFKYCMVPLSSPKNPECIWLAYKHVLDVVPKENHSIVIFSNQKKVELKISRKTLEEKLNKGARLMNTYLFRQEKITDLYRLNMIAEDGMYSVE